jgi:hypothetical protein
MLEKPQLSMLDVTSVRQYSYAWTAGVVSPTTANPSSAAADVVIILKVDFIFRSFLPI